MKNFFAKLLIMFALVVTSVNVCFPSEESCNDSVTSSVESHSNSAEKSSQDSEGHHCLCSMVCHNLFINFPTYTTTIPVIVISKAPYVFTSAIYPQIILSLDKPPII